MLRIWSVLVCLFLFLSGFALAATNEVVATGKYVMGDLDTKTKAKNFALLDAKKMALEKSGTYLRSFSEAKGLQLTTDEVFSLGAGAMSVEILDETWDMQGQNPVITITIKAKIETSDLEAEMKALKSDKLKDSGDNEMAGIGDGTIHHADGKVTIIDSFLAYDISITEVKTRTNTGGLMEVQVTGVNDASSYKKLAYQVDWFDKNGFSINTVLSRWTDFPAYGNSQFGFRAVGPTKAANDFRIKIREEDQ